MTRRKRARMAWRRTGYPLCRTRRQTMPDTMHTVVARFDDPAPAREAMVDLEGRGIAADPINLVDHAPAVATREGGLHTHLPVSRRFNDSYARNGLLGPLLGA